MITPEATSPPLRGDSAVFDQVLGYVETLQRAPALTVAAYPLPSLDALRSHLTVLFDILTDKKLEQPDHDSLRPEGITSTIDHEASHAAAVEMLQEKVGCFAIFMSFASNGAPDIHAGTVWTPSRELSALELAAIALHPVQPSAGDIDATRNLGFPSATAATAAIIKHNEAHPCKTLPVPGSYTLGISLD